MRLGHLFAGAVLACLGINIAGAAGLPPATVQYSADRIVESEQGEMTAKVYSAGGGKERVEMDMGGMQMVTIVRPDKKVMWMLMPMQRMYQEMDMNSAARQDYTGVPDDVQISEMGSETVDGMPTTKYKMILKDKSAGGFVWLNKDNIPVKMDLLSKDGGEKTRVKVTLKNIKVGKQDPALFELPAGYSRMPAMGGFQPGQMPRR